MRTATFPALLVLLLTVFAAPVGLRAESVAVLRLDGDGVAWDALGRINGALGLGAAAAGLDVADVGDATLDELLLLIGCSTVTPACLEDLATTLEVEQIVYGSARPGGAGTEVSLSCFDAPAMALRFSVLLPVDAGFETQVADAAAALLRDEGVAWLRGEAGAVADDRGERRTLPTWITGLGPSTLTVTVRRDDGREARVSLEADGPSVQVVSVDRFRTNVARSPVATAGWIVLGGGVAAGATAAVFGVRTQRLQSDFDAEQRQRQARELADDGNASARITNLMAGGAAVMVAGGAALIVVGSRSRGERVAGAPRMVAGAAGVGLAF
jgi:hypothetical protein